MTNIFGDSSPFGTINRNVVIDNFAEAIQREVVSLSSILNFTKNLSTRARNGELFTFDIQDYSDLVNAKKLASIEFQKAYEKLVIPRLSYTKKNTNSYVALYLFKDTNVSSASIINSKAKYSETENNIKTLDLAEIAKKEKCSAELQKLLTVLDEAGQAVISCRHYLAEAQVETGKFLHQYEMYFRDSIAFDLMGELQAKHLHPKISLSKIFELPTAKSFSSDYSIESLKKNMVSTENSVVLFGEDDFRIQHRPIDGRIYFIGSNPLNNSFLPVNEFVSGFDVVKSNGTIEIEPIYDTNSDLIAASVAIELLQQVKIKFPETYSIVNDQCHKLFLVNGKVSATEAMCVAHMCDKRISTIFDGYSVSKIENAINYFNQVIEQQSEKRARTNAAYA